MPSDVSMSVLTHTPSTSAHRAPVGFGLCLGAGLSVALWTFVGLSLRLIF